MLKYAMLVLKHICGSVSCKDCVDDVLLQRILNKDKLFDYEIKYAIKKQKEGKEEGYVQK